MRVTLASHATAFESPRISIHRLIVPCIQGRIRRLRCQYEAVYSRGKAPTPRPAETVVPDGQGPTFDQRSPVVPTKSHPLELIMTRLGDLPSIAPRPRVAENAREVPSRASPGVEVAGQYSDPTSGLSFLHRAWRRISNENLQVLGGHSGSSDETQLLACAGDKPFQGMGEVSHFHFVHDICYSIQLISSML